MTIGIANNWPNLNITGRVDVDELTVGGQPVTSGNVASVSVVTANGISGTVANPTTTPAITLALGDIAPTGNLTMAASKNVMADWTTSTFNNRTKIMTSTVNGITKVEITPNGTATEAKMNFNNVLDQTNGSIVQIGINATRALIVSSSNGSGTALPLYIHCGAGTATVQLTNDGAIKIGSAANKAIGFFGTTAATQPTAIANATDGTDVITQLNTLLAAMRTLGLIAAA